MTCYHVTTKHAANAILKEGLKPSIGPLSKASDEQNMRVYMFPNKDAMLNAVNNWLIESLEWIYGEDAEFCILKIQLPENFPVQQGGAEYEICSNQLIPPEFITIEDWL